MAYCFVTAISNVLSKRLALSFLILMSLVISIPVASGQQGQQPAQPQTEQAQDESQTANEVEGPTGRREDINEFLGYEPLNIERYLTLPYDTVMNVNMNAYFVELSMLLLLFLPLMYLFGRNNSPWVNLIFILLSILTLSLSVPSAYVNREKVAVEAAPDTLRSQIAATSFSESPLLYTDLVLKEPAVDRYPAVHNWLSRFSGDRDYLSYPILGLIFLVVFFLTQHRVRRHPVESRAVIYYFLVYAFLWWLLSSGIPWYGLMMLPLALIFIVRGVVGDGKWDTWGKRVRNGVLVGFTAVWVAMVFAFRFANFEPTSVEKAKVPFLPSVSQYQAGQIDEDAVFDRVFRQYRVATNVINNDDRSLVYRNGTFMPFFIEKNDQRVFSDNFLDFFKGLNEKYPDKGTLAQVLRAYGFRYFIVDLNLPVNDNTPEQTLKAKFIDFMNFLYRNPYIELVATDRQIRQNSDGQVVFAVFPDIGTVESPGWFAVFRIK